MIKCTSILDDGDGKVTITYSDGSMEVYELKDLPEIIFQDGDVDEQATY